MIKEVRQIANFICFDLEGPLSPQDNAYELMKLFPGGDRIFRVISRYDDILSLEGRPGYEPGDTLALIVPFLLLHGISEADITNLAVKASLTGGAANLLSKLQIDGWKLFCITTTYEQYALHVTHKLNIYAHNVACTPFPLNKLRVVLTKEDTDLLKKIESEVMTLQPVADDNQIRQILDDLFWQKLPATELGATIAEIKPVGGRRKLAALNRFAESQGQPLSKWVAVGDSITDAVMLKAVEDAGGLAIAFNANEYALPQATMGLASTSIIDLFEVLQAWPKGQRKGIERIVREKERLGSKGDRGYFHWLSGRKDLSLVIEVHKRIRQLVREEAGKLG
jgi:energy-converting hydrogenase A subunit R